MIEIGREIPEIIWTDKNTGQKFVIDEDGEKIFILDNGSRIRESDLLLEKEMRLYMEEEEEREKIEQARYEAMLLEDAQRREQEEAEAFDNWWWFYGPGCKDYYK